MIKKFFIIFSFVALVTNVTTVSGAEEAATQKCLHHILEAKDNQQRQATVVFKDCVWRETSSFKIPKIIPDKEERKAKKELKKQVSLEKKAEKKLAKQASLAEKAAAKAEKKRLKAEWKKACAEDSKSKACKEGKPIQRIKKSLVKVKAEKEEARAKKKAEEKLRKQAVNERLARIKAEKELAKQARLEEQERIKAEKAAAKAEKKRLKAEWEKACAEDSKSKACKEGKPIQKLKKLLIKNKN